MQATVRLACRTALALVFMRVALHIRDLGMQ